MVDGQRNIRFILEYDGTDYHGWQIQPDVATVQGVLTKAVRGVLREPVSILASSRTDAGVHALGQVANFRTCSALPLPRIVRGVNALLPDDVAVLSSDEVPWDFHATHMALSKCYRYRIMNGQMRSPIERRFAHFVPVLLDEERMRDAAQAFVGEHDFRAFGRERQPGEGSVRRIFGVAVRREGSIITVEVRGDGFLWNMVRCLVGTLIEVGRGKRTVESVETVLDSRDRTMAGPTAPAKGLFLVSVEYRF